ncbi:MAG: hypothetical protein KC486_30070 [Myxococcales bacterium]|nr:hypothetical protein [Myxococcales bacterium]
MSLRARRLGGLLALAGACGFGWYDYEIRFDVTIGEGVTLPEGAELIAYVEVVESSEPLRETEGGRASTSSEVHEYTIDGKICCVPEPVINFHAFLDLDGDGTWSEDEPHGEDPRNPVTLSDDDKELVVATIEINLP